MTSTLIANLEEASRLPTPPGVVARLLELTRRADVNVREIADALATDAGLTAKILRFVNSPLAGVCREVTSLQQAIALVGIRGVNMMALSFSVLAPNGTGQCRGFDHTQHALQSVGCGVAGRLLAEITQKADPQDAFAAGLLSQIGRSALATALPDKYSEVLTSARAVPMDLPEHERRILGGTYTEVGAWLLRKWNIPETLCTTIEQFRDVHQTPEPSAIAEILHVAETAMAAIIPAHANDDSRTAAFLDEATDHFGFDADQCMDTIKRIATELECTRSLLELPAGQARSAEKIEAEVRERLAELSMAMHMENQCMAVQQEELMRRATTDALTGVGNRAAFDSRLSLEIERSIRSKAHLALLMVDVDHFKRLNDSQGHPAGDRVLQAVAHLLEDSVRKIDYVARYGGEEFAVIAPSTSHDGAVHIAERLRQSVERLRVPWEGRSLNVTISIGVAVFTDVSERHDAAQIIKAADGQLYAAKCAGRNRVSTVVDNMPVACPEHSPSA